MSHEKLLILSDYDNETAIQLIESAYQYILNPKSVPLKKLSFNVRIPFSAIYQFLRTQPNKQISVLDDMAKDLKDKKKSHLSMEIVNALKEKIYLLYGQNYQRVGLLSNYQVAVAQKPQISEYQNPQKYLTIINPEETTGTSTAYLHKQPLDYANCQWKINVVLSTNHLQKVLRPEIILEIQTQQGVKVKMSISQEKFEELRRQMALLLRSSQQIECVKYLII